MEANDYTATAPLSKTEAGVLAVYCSDSRFREPVAEFLSARYPGTGIDQLVLPGGIWWVATLTSLSENPVTQAVLGNLKPLQRAIGFLIKRHQLRQVVLIGHQDCSWYKQRFPHLSAGDLIKQQSADLVRVRDQISKWAEQALAVSGYIATISDSGTVTFNQIF